MLLSMSTARRTCKMSDFYKNPWYKGRVSGSISPEFYDHGDRVKTVYETECGRGRIIQIFKDHYDYLVNGRVVTQRTGWKDLGKQRLADAISAICDGVKEELTTPYYDVDRMQEAYNNGEMS